MGEGHASHFSQPFVALVPLLPTDSSSLIFLTMIYGSPWLSFGFKAVETVTDSKPLALSKASVPPVSSACSCLTCLRVWILYPCGGLSGSRLSICHHLLFSHFPTKATGLWCILGDKLHGVPRFRSGHRVTWPPLPAHASWIRSRPLLCQVCHCSPGSSLLHIGAGLSYPT